MWKQSHCRKGSRPLDKDLSCSGLLVSDGDSEGDSEEENLVWVDEWSKEIWVICYGFLVEKYGDRTNHPKFDQDLWERATGGKKKGKVYGVNSVTDPYVLHGRIDPEIEKLNELINNLVKEKEEEKKEKERLNAVIEELMAEKDKVEKDVLHNRMANIEAMFKTVARK